MQDVLIKWALPLQGLSRRMGELCDRMHKELLSDDPEDGCSASQRMTMFQTMARQSKCALAMREQAIKRFQTGRDAAIESGPSRKSVWSPDMIEAQAMFLCAEDLRARMERNQTDYMMQLAGAGNDSSDSSADTICRAIRSMDMVHYMVQTAIRTWTTKAPDGTLMIDTMPNDSSRRIRHPWLDRVMVPDLVPDPDDESKLVTRSQLSSSNVPEAEDDPLMHHFEQIMHQEQQQDKTPHIAGRDTLHHPFIRQVVDISHTSYSIPPRVLLPSELDDYKPKGHHGIGGEVHALDVRKRGGKLYEWEKDIEFVELPADNVLADAVPMPVVVPPTNPPPVPSAPVAVPGPVPPASVSVPGARSKESTAEAAAEAAAAAARASVAFPCQHGYTGDSVCGEPSVDGLVICARHCPNYIKPRKQAKVENIISPYPASDERTQPDLDWCRYNMPQHTDVQKAAMDHMIEACEGFYAVDMVNKSRASTLERSEIMLSRVLYDWEKANLGTWKGIVTKTNHPATRARNKTNTPKKNPPSSSPSKTPEVYQGPQKRPRVDFSDDEDRDDGQVMPVFDTRDGKFGESDLSDSDDDDEDLCPRKKIVEETLSSSRRKANAKARKRVRFEDDDDNDDGPIFF